jgi:predicted nicotinamide N-methyase
MQVIKSSPHSVEVSFARTSNQTITLSFNLVGRQEDLVPLFSSGSLWDSMIWESSVFTMCNFIQFNLDAFRGKNVVELGCGLGLPGKYGHMKRYTAICFDVFGLKFEMLRYHKIDRLPTNM